MVVEQWLPVYGFTVNSYTSTSFSETFMQLTDVQQPCFHFKYCLCIKKGRMKNHPSGMLLQMRDDKFLKLLCLSFSLFYFIKALQNL